MTDNKNAENTGFQEGVVKLDARNVSKIFKKIKEKGILANSINAKAKRMPPSELLESEDFIDKIKYYRLLNGWNRFELSRRAGICQRSYDGYEKKSTEMQDWRVAEKLLIALKIEDKVEMPPQFKIKKKYPMDKILDIIKQYGKREFSRRTGIAETTINTWFCKGAPNQLANAMYKKMVKLFDEDNIEY